MSDEKTATTSAAKSTIGTTTQVTKKNAASEATGADNSVMYIGPNRLTDGLKRFTVYRGTPTAFIAQVSGKYKNISRLFVPVEKLNEAMKNVETKGTPVFLAFHEVERGE